jgi:hypothetical protein
MLVELSTIGHDLVKPGALGALLAEVPFAAAGFAWFFVVISSQVHKHFRSQTIFHHWLCTNVIEDS